MTYRGRPLAEAAALIARSYPERIQTSTLSGLTPYIAATARGVSFVRLTWHLRKAITHGSSTVSCGRDMGRGVT